MTRYTTGKDTEQKWPMEYRCPGCSTWAFEISFSSNDVPRCDECGEKITEFDDLDSRPSRLQDRIEDVILTIKTIEEDREGGDAHNNDSDGYGRKTPPSETRDTGEYMDDDHIVD